MSESRKIFLKKGEGNLGYWMVLSSKTLYWIDGEERSFGFRHRTLRRKANQQWKVRECDFPFIS